MSAKIMLEPIISISNKDDYYYYENLLTSRILKSKIDLIEQLDLYNNKIVNVDLNNKYVFYLNQIGIIRFIE